MVLRLSPSTRALILPFSTVLISPGTVCSAPWMDERLAEIERITARRGGKVLIISPGASPNGKESVTPPTRLINAIRQGHPGDTLLLRGGRYTREKSGEIWLRERIDGGAEGRPFTIMPFPGEKVLFDNYAIKPGGVSYITIRGIEFRDRGTVGSGHHFRILDNHYNNLAEYNYPKLPRWYLGRVSKQHTHLPQHFCQLWQAGYKHFKRCDTGHNQG